MGATFKGHIWSFLKLCFLHTRRWAFSNTAKLLWCFASPWTWDQLYQKLWAETSGTWSLNKLFPSWVSYVMQTVTTESGLKYQAEETCHQLSTGHDVIFLAPFLYSLKWQYTERFGFIRFSPTPQLAVGIPMLPTFPYKSTKMEISRVFRSWVPSSLFSTIHCTVFKFNLWYMWPAKQIYKGKTESW